MGYCDESSFPRVVASVYLKHVPGWTSMHENSHPLHKCVGKTSKYLQRIIAYTTKRQGLFQNCFELYDHRSKDIFPFSKTIISNISGQFECYINKSTSYI